MNAIFVKRYKELNFNVTERKNYRFYDALEMYCPSKELKRYQWLAVKLEKLFVEIFFFLTPTDNIDDHNTIEG